MIILCGAGMICLHIINISALLFTFVVNNNALFLSKYARKVACGRSFQYKKR